MNFKRKLFAGLKWSSIGSIGLSVFQLLQISILTSYLPKEVFGLIALAVLVVNFTNLFVEMGLTSAIFYKQGSTRKEYSSLFWLNMSLSVLLYFILFQLAAPIALFYAEPDLTMIIQVLGLNIIITSIGKQHKALLQKKLEFDIVAKIDLFSYLIGLLVAIFLAWKGMGVYSLVWSSLTSSFISSVILFYIRFKDDPILFHFSIRETKPFVRIGGFSLGSSILDFFSREVDIIIIGKFVGAEFLGVYSLAKQVSLKAYSAMMPIIFSVFNPLLSSMNKNKERMESYFLQIVYGVTYITFPIYLIIILAAAEILTILYGFSYSEGSYALIALTIFQACFTVVKPAGSLQISTGRTDIGFYWTILRNILTILTLILAVTIFEARLIPIFLAGLGTLLVFYLWNMQIKKMTSIGFKTYVRQFIYPIAALFSVTFIKLVLLDTFITSNSPFIAALLKILAGLSLYMVFVFVLDRKRILHFYKKIAKK